MNFQGKEEVESAVLMPVGLGSMEGASLDSIPSRSRNCTGVVPLKKQRKRASGIDQIFEGLLS